LQSFISPPPTQLSRAYRLRHPCLRAHGNHNMLVLLQGLAILRNGCFGAADTESEMLEARSRSAGEASGASNDHSSSVGCCDNCPWWFQQTSGDGTLQRWLSYCCESEDPWQMDAEEDFELTIVKGDCEEAQRRLPTLPIFSSLQRPQPAMDSFGDNPTPTFGIRKELPTVYE